MLWSMPILAVAHFLSFLEPHFYPKFSAVILLRLGQLALIGNVVAIAAAVLYLGVPARRPCPFSVVLSLARLLLA